MSRYAIFKSNNRFLYYTIEWVDVSGVTVESDLTPLIFETYGNDISTIDELKIAALPATKFNIYIWDDYYIVVYKFNELETAIDDLAGVGRTTETVKGNADDLGTHIGNTTDAHGIDTKATTATYTATILNAEWIGASAPYSQSIAVAGMLATDAPIVDIDISGAADYTAELALLDAWADIYRITTQSNAITVYSISETINIPITLKVVR